MEINEFVKRSNDKGEEKEPTTIYRFVESIDCFSKTQKAQRTKENCFKTNCSPAKIRKSGIEFETIASDIGSQTIVVRRANIEKNYNTNNPLKNFINISHCIQPPFFQ